MGEGVVGEFSLLFEFEKATKNTCKYAEKPEAGQPPRIGSLYIQKWAFGTESPPTRLRMTVEKASDPEKQGKEQPR